MLMQNRFGLHGQSSVSLLIDVGDSNGPRLQVTGWPGFATGEYGTPYLTVIYGTHYREPDFAGPPPGDCRAGRAVRQS